MRKLLIVILAVTVCFALPLMAQEKEMGKKEMDKKEMSEDMGQMQMPQPLNDEFMSWLVGEWEGTSESEHGQAKEWEKIEMGLDGQFLFHHAKSDMGEMSYQGRGVTTLDPETGKIMGFWIDNFRGMYKGEGTREGDKVTMTWKGNQGTYTNTIQKMGPDKYTSKYTFTDPAGNSHSGSAEMSRVEKMTDKK